jgi:hypothetical protein
VAGGGNGDVDSSLSSRVSSADDLTDLSSASRLATYSDLRLGNNVYFAASPPTHVSLNVSQKCKLFLLSTWHGNPVPGAFGSKTNYRHSASSSFGKNSSGKREKRKASNSCLPSCMACLLGRARRPLLCVALGGRFKPALIGVDWSCKEGEKCVVIGRLTSFYRNIT